MATKKYLRNELSDAIAKIRLYESYLRDIRRVTNSRFNGDIVKDIILKNRKYCDKTEELNQEIERTNENLVKLTKHILILNGYIDFFKATIIAQKMQILDMNTIIYKILKLINKKKAKKINSSIDSLKYIKKKILKLKDENKI